MDMKEIAAQLLSSDSLKGIAQNAGVSTGDVKKVLSQALPALLSGAEDQSKNGGEGFTNALTKHAASDTSDLGAFLGNIDLADGAKIIGHLLGGNTASTTKEVAKKTGVSKSNVGTILASAGPLLMSLLGKGSLAGGIGELLSNLDLGDLLVDLLGDSGSKKKTKKSAGGLGDILGSVLKSFLK